MRMSEIDRMSHVVQSSLQSALLNLAEQHIDVVMPGYTHLQRAQPIFFAHYMLAQIEAFERDADRIERAVADPALALHFHRIVLQMVFGFFRGGNVEFVAGAPSNGFPLRANSSGSRVAR